MSGQRSALSGRRRGFSLLEVMVAIAILGLTLTVILSAQGGLAASNRSAANMGQAVQLGRCKMTELEEKLLKFGFPVTDDINQEVVCCEDESNDRFTCDTRVEKVELPNFQSGNSLGDGGALVGPGANPSSNPLVALANPAGSSAALDLNVDGGGLAGGANGLMSQLGLGQGGAGAEGLIGMVMGIIYPFMKPMYEMSIRRVTVTVKWKEGPNARELPIIQYITNPQQSPFAMGMLGADGGVMDLTAPGSSASGAPATGPAPTTGSNPLAPRPGGGP